MKLPLGKKNFYAITLIYKESGKKIRKFGVTSLVDVMDRFRDYYDNNVLYNEFYISYDFSWILDSEKADSLEYKFLNRFPKNFYLESYLNKPFNYFNNFSGITEMTTMSDKNWKKVLNVLKELRRREEY